MHLHVWLLISLPYFSYDGALQEILQVICRDASYAPIHDKLVTATIGATDSSGRVHELAPWCISSCTVLIKFLPVTPEEMKVEEGSTQFL